MPDVVFVVALTIIAAFIAAIAQYLFKVSMPKFNVNKKELIQLAKNRSIILGLLIYLISLVIYLFALKSDNLSFVYPTFASVFIFVLLISKFKLHENVSMKRVVGIVVMLIGIVLVVLTY